jgi:hypothetical protein
MIQNYKCSNYLKLLAACMALIVFGCSTQKDALLNRSYHQINTKYNGLFYAKEHLKEGVKKIEKLHLNNYSEILTINKLGTPKSAQSAKSSLDRAIEKATLAIQKHSMDIGGQEKNKFIDNNYLIIGKAKFYKQEYSQAINTFSYILRKTNLIDVKIEAILWATLSHNKLNNTEAVRNSINILNDDYLLKEADQSILHEIEAELAIERGYYLEAIAHLRKAIDLSKNRDKKTRMNYILGQLSIETGNLAGALDYFLKVIKKASEYEILFNAQLSMAKAYDPNASSLDVEQELMSMIKDKKNTEYLDQIYYAIGSINIKNQDTTAAIGSFTLSSSLSQFNNEQKSQSHYALANIFWKKKEYIQSFNHCDSAFQVTKPNAPNYQQIKTMLTSAKRIAQQYNIINYNDSIIALANLSELERNKFIEDYIVELKIKDEQDKGDLQNNSNQNSSFNQYDYNRQSTNSMQVASGGGWYFYNPSAISLGYSEFLSRWGNRELGDNWRRKNKTDDFLDEDVGLELMEDQPDDREKYSRAYYISKLPIDLEQQTIILSKTETAYYNLAVIFKESLQDYEQSIKIYVELLDRFPDTEYRPLIYFDKYNVHLLQKDSISAQVVFNKIKDEYPGSEYYKLLLGQDHNINNKEKDNDNKIYKIAYDLYSEYSYGSCEKLNDLAENNYNNVFIAQIELLNVFCHAKQLDRASYIQNLENLLEKHPQSIISTNIDTLLMTLRGEYVLDNDSVYQNSFSSPHSFFILMQDATINLPETQLNISRFNKREYKLDSLEIVNLLLTKNLQLLKVQSFKNKVAAKIYYDLIKGDSYIKDIVNINKSELFIISDLNFITLIKEKDINRYRDYFNKIYLLN